MTGVREAHAAVESVFASLAASGTALEWLDGERLQVTVDGTCEGMSIDLEDPVAWIRLKAADRIQTIVMEATHQVVPPCPRHPGLHPLLCRVIDDCAVWQCPQDLVTVRAV